MLKSEGAIDRAHKLRHIDVDTLAGIIVLENSGDTARVDAQLQQFQLHTLRQQAGISLHLLESAKVANNAHSKCRELVQIIGTEARQLPGAVETIPSHLFTVARAITAQITKVGRACKGDMAFHSVSNGVLISISK